MPEIMKHYKQLIDDLNNLGYQDQIAAGQRAREIAHDARQAGHEGYAQFFEGEASFYEGDLETACSIESEALQLLPDVPFLLSNYAVVLMVHGMPEKALQYYDLALEMCPEDTHALCCKGVTMANLGHEEEALALFDKALTIHPDQTKLENGSLSKHDDKCPPAREINPYYWQTLMNKGVLLANLSRSGEALNYFDQALQVNPGNPRILKKKGDILMNLGRNEEALTHFDQVLEQNQENTQALRNKGITLSKMNRYQEALEYFHNLEKLVELNHFDLAVTTKLYEELKQLDKAKISAKQWISALEENDLPTEDATEYLKNIEQKKN
ncbi:tetratricopeptide repeat protein [candidate division CSSED10-310 bacterium]|uniref:Tetratricopeptide repeat protein n=1 Tax=candidate division CSSED10-310 bacterium TaxID=2855610 RepID=A0ABV6Z3Z3_UNCC1